MTNSSFPFEGQSTTEDQYSKLFREFTSNGVSGGIDGGQCKVTANSTGMKVTVAAGLAVVRGHCFWATASNDVTIAAASPQTRVDSVVLRLDPTANSIVLAVVQGDPATGLPAALVQTDTGIWEHLLAYVTVRAGTPTIAASDVADMRKFLGRQMGAWSTSQRPVSPIKGHMGLNTDLGRPEFWDGTQWSLNFGPLEPDWVALTGFAAGAGPRDVSRTPSYKLYPDGKRVKLRGHIAAGSSFASSGVVVIPTLPNTIIPNREVVLNAPTNFSGSITANARWSITPDGKLWLYCGSGVTWASLDGIEYEVT